MSDIPAVNLEQVTKSFGRKQALAGLSLRVQPGEVHGFLGPNGAGKSTTLRILLGLLRHDAGTAQVLGKDPWADAVELHSRLAYVPGDVALWPNLTGGEAIDLFMRLRGSANPARRDELIERFDLDPRAKARTYSKGNRQKVALIAALASEVELLLLDEPTSGLDPLMEAQFQECISGVRQQGRSILLSSHILAQVEALADTVSIIRRGVVVESGSLEQLRHLASTSISLRLREPREVIEVLRGTPGVHDVHSREGMVRFSADQEHLPQIMQLISDWGVASLTATPPTLEQLLLRHYGEPGTTSAERK
ncbi:ABC transporter ATP-binding protein [Glutamicibacter sp. PS]|uniref:ABC transporter ATP-binding protein n=1 Tax=Glutamicibacter sp. PS TaxID=3075634 RepID=UPI002852894F|nr:ABC transporter ATP-binding protein [Glutamicibacter sp. PS]